MKLLLVFVACVLSASTAHAAAGINPILECSTIAIGSGSSASSFEACATSSFSTPSPLTFENGTTVYLGGYVTTYAIYQGLKEGTDTTALSAEATKQASTLGMTVFVGRNDDNSCEIVVGFKAETTSCKSCVYCGDDKYSVDCTGVKNGRKVTCESQGEGDVFFPLTAAALKCTGGATGMHSAKPPKAAAVQAPRVPAKVTARAPVKAPRVPTKATARAPVRAPKKVIPTAPVKGNAVAAPVRAPRAMARVAAPVK